VTGHPADREALDVGALGAGLLEQARGRANGHASRLVIGGTVQRAVLMALTAGASLGEHESPPAATFHVLSGRARLYAAGAAEWVVAAGQVVAIPPNRHAVEALEDSIILLTVALR